MVAVLEVNGLHRFYSSGTDNEIAALKDVSFTVYAGEFVAIMGPSGSGKSTLLSILAGLDEPNGGSIFVAGQRMSHQSPITQARIRGALIGIVTQTSGLIEHLSLEQNVTLARSLRSHAQAEFQSSSHSIEGGFTVETEFDLLEKVGLVQRRSSRPSTLSGGETSRANIAVALAGGPMLLLADEPTAEISEAEEKDVIALLSSLRPDFGATVVVTHSEVVARAADRVIELFDGKCQ